MTKNVVWAVVFVLIAALLQSTLLARLETLLSRVTIYHALPDLALGIIVFSAYMNGTMTGQFTGFFSGLLLDCLSGTPLGFNALIYTLVGALAGRMQGIFVLDAIFLPMMLCAGTTLFKEAAALFLLHLLLPAPPPSEAAASSYTLFAPTFWGELGFNVFLAIPLFALLKLLQPLLVGKNSQSGPQREAN